MAQHDHILDNANGAAFRSDANLALAAIVSNNSGATEPTPTYPFMWWFDTTSSLLKIRSAANTAWVTLGSLVGDVWTPYSEGSAIPAIFGTAAGRNIGTAAGDVAELISGGLLARGLLQTMVGATDTVAGQSGAVPAPAATGLDLFLHRNGSWQPALRSLTGNPSSYVRLPTTNGDLLVQWGIGPGVATGQVAITFPTAYASNPIVMATPTTPGASRVASIRILSAAGVTIRVTDINNGVSSEDIHWMALGAPA